MLKKCLVFALVFTVAYGAHAQTTAPAQSVTLSPAQVTIQTAAPPAEAATDLPSLCADAPLFGDLSAFLLTPGGTTQVVFNGESRSVPGTAAVYDAEQPWASPAICSLTPIQPTNVAAFSPSGVAFTPNLWQYELDAVNIATVVQLPLEAASQPGRWRLAASTVLGRHEIGVQVPVVAQPLIVDGTSRYNLAPAPTPIVDDNRLLVAGFRPNERVVLIDTANEGEALLPADTTGALLLDGAVVPNVYIGENGTYLATSPVEGVGAVTFTTPQEAQQVIFDLYWGQNGLALNLGPIPEQPILEITPAPEQGGQEVVVGPDQPMGGPELQPGAESEQGGVETVVIPVEPTEEPGTGGPLVLLPIANFTATTAAPSTTLRAGPSTAAPALGTIARGERILLIGRNADGTWVRLNGDAERWVNVRDLIPFGDVRALDVVAVDDAAG